MGTLIVGLVLLAVLGLAARKIYIGCAGGKGCGCGSGCEDCPSCAKKTRR